MLMSDCVCRAGPAWDPSVVHQPSISVSAGGPEAGDIRRSPRECCSPVACVSTGAPRYIVVSSWSIGPHPPWQIRRKSGAISSRPIRRSRRGARRLSNPTDGRRSMAPPVPGVPLGLYLHIPFCRKRCHFCYFRVYTDKNAQEVGDYLDVLAREWELYANLPSIAGRPLNFVLLRRRHAVVPVDEATRGSRGAPQRGDIVARGRGSHLRVRARHVVGSRSSRRSAASGSRA